MTSSNIVWKTLRRWAAPLAVALTLAQPATAGLFDGGGSTCPPNSSCIPPGGGTGGGGSGGGGSGGGGGMCTIPGGGGNTSCGGGGAASQGGGTGGGAQVGGGNPINLISGNKHQEETDLAPLPGVLGLEFKRYYNSDSRQRGLTGVGWRSSYETVLVDLGHAIQIIQADGRRLEFVRGSGSQAHLCTSASPLSDGQVRIEELPGGRRQYHWRWIDGRTLSFSGGSGAGQPLQSITAATGERVSLSYNPMGDLVDVRDPAGRRLTFIYVKPAAGQRAPLVGIDTPLGRLAYRHDDMGRIVQVAQAAGAQAAPHLVRTYHYEPQRQAGNPYALTGISASGTDSAGKPQPEQRLSTYAYDEQGRAVLSTKGLPLQMQDGKPVAGTGIEQIQVRYLQKAEWLNVKVVDGEAQPKQFGRTEVTNSLGGKTELVSAVVDGHYRLIEVRGAGCSTCGPADMRYGWDAQGRMVRATKLDAQGKPVDSEVRRYDAYGRLASVGRQRHDAQGKAQAVQWLERYEYSDLKYADGSIAVAPQPSLIARPSVVAGQEHVLRVAYNERWQPTKVTEQGYSPIDAKGELSPSPIERSTSYTYAQVNGRSVLTQIDGPLPNGPRADPSDSDITRFEWNERGDALLRINHPMNQATVFEHDAATGRVIKHVGVDGVVTRLRYGPTGALESLDRAGVVTRYTQDAQGRMASVLDPTGQALRIGYDVAGHIASIADGQNNLISLERDAEGRLARTRLLNPDGSVSQQGRAYESAGLAAVAPGSDAVLAAVARITSADRALDQLARPEVTLQPYAAIDGYMADRTAEPAPATTTALDSDGRITTYWRDDLGRLVRVQSPTTGITRYFYDVAGRLQARLQQDDSRADYTRDAAGRVVAVVARDAQGKVDEEAAIEWGPANKPARVRYLAGEERFAYDAAGRLTEHVQIVDGKSMRIGYAFNAAGQMVSRTLPDGRTLDYRYRGAVHPRAGLLESVWLRGFVGDTAQSLSGGLLDRPVVQGLNDQADRFTQRGFQFGNGLTNQLVLDDQGRVVSAGNAQVGQTRLAYAADAAASAGAGAGQSGAEPSTEPRRVDQLRPIGLGRQAQAEVTQAWISRLQAQAASWRGDAEEPDAAATGGVVQQILEARTGPLGRQMARGEQRFRYDSLGRLVEVTRAAAAAGDAPVARYRYNLFGQRIAKTVAAQDGRGTRTTYYFHDGSQLVAELDDAGTVASQYIWLNDKPVSMLRDSRLYAVHTDHRNAPLALTDESRAVVWQASVADYLLATPAQGARLGRIAFNLRGSNQYADAETGLHYNTHRYYDPVAARYLTPDPMGLAVGPDLYAFALGQPHSMSDPLGLAPVSNADGSLKGWTYEDKLSEIINRAIPKLPSEIGAALKELVKPENLAVMGAVFAGFVALQATPFGWIADAALLGWGAWMIGSGITELIKTFLDLHKNINSAKCEGDLDAAASALAKGFVSSTGEVVGGIAGVWGTASSGGLTRIANGIKTLVEFGKARFGGIPKTVVIEGNAGAAPAAPPLKSGLGGTVDQAETGVQWGKGIQGQGNPFENWVQTKLPPGTQQTPTVFKTIDHINRGTGRITSTKTLDTTTTSRVGNPKQIYNLLKGYVDALRDFAGYKVGNFEVTAAEIKSREIQLGIPADTTAAQWAEIARAVEYAASQGIDLIVTVLKP